jgi:hypothetical protein
MFLANSVHTFERSNTAEPDFAIDQSQAENLLALLVDGIKTTCRKRARKELKRGDRVAVKFFETTGEKRGYVSVATLQRIDRSAGADSVSWIVKWEGSPEEAVWNPIEDWEFFVVQ